MNKPPMMQVNNGIMAYDMKMQPQYDFSNFQSNMYDTRTVAPVGTPPFLDGNYLVNQEQMPVDMKQDTCRDYLRGKCLRGVKCKYRHPDNNEISVSGNVNTQKVTFCRNYQRGKCTLANCRYIHSSRTDEEFYFQTGRLPQQNDSFMQSQNDNYSNFMPSMNIPTTFSNTHLQTMPSLGVNTTNNIMDIANNVHNLISDIDPNTSFNRHSSNPEQSQSPPIDQEKVPSQKTLSQSSNSVSDYNGDKTPGSKARRWSLDHHDNNGELNTKHSPLYTSLRDEAFRNGEVDLLKIRIGILEDKVKTLDFYNEMLREQNVQLKQQVKRHENPFSPIYKPTIQDTDYVN